MEGKDSKRAAVPTAGKGHGTRGSSAKGNPTKSIPVDRGFTEGHLIFRLLGGEDRVTHTIRSTLLVRLIVALAPIAVMVLIGGFAISRVAQISSVCYVGFTAIIFLAQWYGSFDAAVSKREFLRRQWGWALFSILMPTTVCLTSLFADRQMVIYVLSFWVLLAVLPRAMIAILHNRICADRPAVSLTATFAMVIIVGSLLLTYSPRAANAGVKVNWIDALFTSTSAVCVTGLESISTIQSFSPFGQTVVMVLIQTGGLGIMTLGSFMLLTAGRRLGVGDRQLMRDALNLDSTGGIGAFVASVIASTAVIELIGAACLYPHFRDQEHPIFYALFHSVSSFCNAGFALYTDNLMGFAQTTSLNIVIMLLIFLGGIGFTVITDVVRRFLPKKVDDVGVGGFRLSVHTKLALIMSFFLIVVGAGGIYGLERKSGVLAEMSTGDAVVAATFQSVSARTAGFNTIQLAQDKDPATKEAHVSTLFWITGLMIIGASPGSTGGGVKTVTTAVLLLGVTALFRQRARPQIFGRSIAEIVVTRAAAIFMVYLMTLFAGVLALEIMHGRQFTLDQIIFECASALGTVGYTAGISGSPDFSDGGKLILILLMFAGRLGPLTLVLLTVKSRQTRATIEYPEENVMIG